MARDVFSVTHSSKLSLIFFLFLLSWSEAVGKVPIATLREITVKSEIVIRGRVESCTNSKKMESCLVRVINVYKGTENAASLRICSAVVGADYPNLKNIVGKEVVLFLERYGNCLSITQGYRGVIRIERESAFSGVISDLPIQMPLLDFERAIEGMSQQEK